MLKAFRVVLDTNTLLRGLVSPSSAASRIRRAAEERLIIPLVSKPVLDEYRAVLMDPQTLQRFPEITSDLVEITVRRLRFVGDYLRSPAIRFEFRRDVRDQKFVELAIALKATHLITSDKDLLTLPSSRGDAGKRFRQRLPQMEVTDPGGFLRKYGDVLGIAS